MSAPNKLMRVRIPANGTLLDDVEWLTLDASGQPVQTGLCRLAAVPPYANIELVIPASLVAQHVLEVPPVAARHENAVIRQLLEDRVLAGMDDCHFVRGTREGKLQTVWVVSRRWMLELSDACRAANLFPQRALPEQALLAPQSYASTPDGVVYCTSTGVGGILPAPDLLEAVAGESLTAVDSLLAAKVRSPANLFEGLPALHRAAAIPTRLLVTAGVLIGGIALAYLVAQCLTWRQLASQETQLRDAIRQNFAAAHPGVPIVDPILQWRQLHGKTSQAGGDALDQLSHLALNLARDVHPQRLDIEGNTIKITVGASDAAILKPVLQEKGLSFDSQTTDKGLEQLVITRPAQGGRS